MLREAAAAAGPRALIRMPGYRQGRALRAAYAEATALVFPSLCESFGIPAVEAMAQGTPVALADSTALPEIGGEAGWYFDPVSDEAITATLRRLLDDGQERSRRVELGRSIAAGYNWQASNDRLVAAALGCAWGRVRANRIAAGQRVRRSSHLDSTLRFPRSIARFRQAE